MFSPGVVFHEQFVSPFVMNENKRTRKSLVTSLLLVRKGSRVSHYLKVLVCLFESRRFGARVWSGKGAVDTHRPELVSNHSPYS